MRIRSFLIAAAFAAAAAAPGVAQLSAAKADWAKGPVQFLMTNEEKAMWQKLPSDDAAIAFIDLFWARRDPTPNTPQNEFRQEFEQRVKYADQTFKGGRQRGSLSDRGKILVLFGQPTHATKTSAKQPNAFEDETSTTPGVGMQQQEPTRMSWIYEGDEAQKLFGVPRAEFTFVDQFNNGDFRLTNARIDVNAAQQKVIAASIAQPNLTKAPTFTQQATATPQQPAAPAAPAAPADALKTQALRDAIAAEKGGSSALKKGSIVYAEFVSPSGEFYVPVGITVAKGEGVSADAYDTVFGQIDDANGAVVASFEQAAKPTAFKNGVFADRAVSLPSGKYTAIIGLAKGGVPAVIGARTLDVTSLAKDAPGTSKLIVSNDLVELPEAAPEKTGFAFGKMKVIPTAEFGRNDNLIFFVELHNPGIDPATNAPKLQSSLDFSGGKFKKPISRPLTEQPVAPLSGKPGPGQYAIIDSIPIGDIKDVAPGDYTLKMKIVDTVTKQSYTVEQSFKIIG